MLRSLLGSLLESRHQGQSRIQPGKPPVRKRRPSIRPRLERLEDRLAPSAGLFVQTNLVSDVAGMAATTDPNLINPWALTSSSTSLFWVANQGSGTSTLYNGQGQPQPPGNNPPFTPLIVTIPTNPADNPTPAHGSPTGDVFNTASSAAGSTAFDLIPGNTRTSAIFLFATTDGTISGWNPGVNRTNAVIGATHPGAEYTGLAIANDSKAGTLLYAADFSNNAIDVYDTNFKLVTTLPGDFTDPNLPSGYRVFNVQAIDNKLYVEYATFNPATGGVQPGTGHGVVDVYNTDGTLDTNVNGTGRLITGGVLNDPWGVTRAPSSFGAFSNDLLVGNFGRGNINAFDPMTGNFLGELKTRSGQPFDVQHLWSLQFGNGASAGPSNTLFFTAGLTSNFGSGTGTPHGLFGSLQAVPALPEGSPIVTNLGNFPQQTISTVPTNGDVNPYGVAFVPQNFQGGGVLKPGDLLVSNFNDSSNVPGTGTTIARITPSGGQSVFFQGTGLGLTTALGVLKSGFVIVGNVPTDANGVVQQGSLLILDTSGKVVTTLSDSARLDGPWDLALNDQGDFAQVFVSNVLSGTVTRIDLDIPKGGTPMVESETQIASGYAHQPNPLALVVGPTGLAFDPRTDTLYVASTADNAIFAIPRAGVTLSDHGTGRMIFNDPAHLNGPLGLTLAPNGHLIVANGDAVNPDPNHINELVEITPLGKFVGEFRLDPSTPGAAFGIAVQQVGDQVRFAAVDDNTNTLDVWTFQTVEHPAKPSISTTAGQPVVLGTNTPLSDSANLTGGSNPTGTITFYLFTPGDPGTNLATAVFTDTLTVNGDSTYSTGTGMTTGSAVPTMLGNYEWVAVYSGDMSNSPVSSKFGDEPQKDEEARIVLTPPSETDPFPDATGGTFTAQVDVSSDGINWTHIGAGVPVTFSLVNNSIGATIVSPTGLTNSSGEVTMTVADTSMAGTVAIHASTSFMLTGVSGTFTAATGTAPSSNDALKSFIPNVVTPGITTTAGPSVALGSGNPLSDTADLENGNNPTGTITFELFDPTGTIVFIKQVAVSGNGMYSSTDAGTTITGSAVPTMVGTYVWVASYSGDTNNASVSSGTGDEPVTVTSSPPLTGGDKAEIG
jgi:uncharacterized protein (TIGR03118 family)